MTCFVISRIVRTQRYPLRDTSTVFVGSALDISLVVAWSKFIHESLDRSLNSTIIVGIDRFVESCTAPGWIFSTEVGRTDSVDVHFKSVIDFGSSNGASYRAALSNFSSIVFWSSDVEPYLWIWDRIFVISKVSLIDHINELVLTGINKDKYCNCKIAPLFNTLLG